MVTIAPVLIYILAPDRVFRGTPCPAHPTPPLQPLSVLLVPTSCMAQVARLNAEGMLSKVQAELARLRDFDQVRTRLLCLACPAVAAAEHRAQPVAA